MTGKQYRAGIDFISHALPAREAIWWGCLCLQHACGDDLNGSDKTACIAVVQWVLQPSEGNRTAAKAPGDAAGFESPAGLLAMAVNQTGGSLARLSPPAIAVATAVKFASTKVDPAKIVDTQRLFVELGVGVAEGRYM